MEVTCNCTSVNGYDCLTDEISCIDGVDCIDGICKGMNCLIAEGGVCYSGDNCECGNNGCICKSTDGSGCSLENLRCYGGSECRCDYIDKRECFCKNPYLCELEKRECINPSANSGCLCDINGKNCYCYTSYCMEKPTNTFCDINHKKWQCKLEDEDCHKPESQLSQKCYDLANYPCRGPEASKYKQCLSPYKECHVTNPDPICLKNSSNLTNIYIYFFIFFIICIIMVFIIKNIYVKIGILSILLIVLISSIIYYKNV